MPNMIRDGKGKGYLAQVDSNNRLRVSAESESIQHLVSLNEQNAYQCIGTTTLAAGTVTALHIKNISTTKNLVVTYIRHQIIDAAGGTDFPNVSNYFSASVGRTYSADGTVLMCVNVRNPSANTPEVLIYHEAPTLAGTAKEFDRWYTKADGDMNTFNKEGALILGPTGTLELSYVGDKTSGTIYTRISYIMKKIR